MGGPNDKASELDRSGSLRASVRFSNVQPDDDDYDLQAMAISDGFRPPEVAHNHHAPHVSRPSVSSFDISPARTVSPRPSSISKPHRHHESLTLRNEGTSMDPFHDPMPTRASSVSTSSAFMNVETPYDGPRGPSHPYQMYPQDVRLARTASLATTSTAPVSERSYNGPRGPTHPYGMYPQNTVPEVDASGIGDGPVQRDINVGFPGATDNYQRRIGPDGEDAADLIGPDGHTEQLPPYTRYPEETYQRKALGIDTPQPVPAQPMLAIPGAGGIGLATRNPEFSSTEDLGGAVSPESRRSVRSFNSETSHHEINTAALAVTDEKKPAKTWKEAARKRVWGIVPCWALVLAIIVLLMMGVVLGAVIGTLFGPHLRKGPPRDDKPPQPAVTTITYDATPLSTVPASLPPLAEGTFAMPIMNTRAPNTCFKDTTQAQTWNCNMVFSQLAMSIQKLTGVPDVLSYAMSFQYNDTYTMAQKVYSYGMQPPDLTNLQLKLVNDTFEPSRGPAWAFEVPYNKTVIIPQEFLSPSTSSATSSSSSTSEKSRRMLFGGDFKRKGIAQAGDKPWICYWDSTILETFIYAGQNSSFSRPGSSFPPPPNPTPTSSTTNLARALLTSTAPTANVLARDDFRPSYSGREEFPETFVTTATVASSTTTDTVSSSSATPDFFSMPPMPPDSNPPYPRVVKLEERRIPDYAQTPPWCRQYEILGEGIEAVPVKDDKGNYIEVQIYEEDTDYGTSGSSKRDIIEGYLASRDSSGSLGNDMSDCGCMWWLT
ncbi:hypothetical protein F4775DRAFT_302211 [Biscogniauxia sp. FL1348]|nr:hypothetical protein F4775DRAFT_302211 [Biscogniauxia sp. FL1348]